MSDVVQRTKAMSDRRAEILAAGCGLATLDEYNVLTLKLAEAAPNLIAEVERLTARDDKFRATVRNYYDAVEDRMLASGNTAAETSRHANEMAGLRWAFRAFEGDAS